MPELRALHVLGGADLHQRAAHSKQPGQRAPRIKAKIGVPRLNGERMGVLATRTPHRWVPPALLRRLGLEGGGCVRTD